MLKKSINLIILLALTIPVQSLPSKLQAASAIAYSPQAYGYSFNVATVEEAERLAIEMA